MALTSSTSAIQQFDSSSDSSYKKQIAQLKPYQKIKCPKILQMSDFPSNTFLSGNNFVETVNFANRNHLNFVNGADDFWAAIMTQFSFYINKNAENFRHKFVPFKGRKTLKVRVQGSLTSEIYNQFVKKMTKKIGKNLIDSKVKRWILPSFSTTTQDTLVTFGVILMATMKNYFRYRLELKCGVPSNKLEKPFKIKKCVRLLTRLEKLKEYGLDTWCDLLRNAINFLMSGDDEGDVGLDYWQKVCDFEEGKTSYLCGWMTVFCGFGTNGNWKGGELVKRLRIDMNDIPRGIVNVRVKIRGDVGTGTGGGLRKSLMTAGHMGFTFKTDEDGQIEVEPALGWAIALKT